MSAKAITRRGFLAASAGAAAAVAGTAMWTANPLALAEEEAGVTEIVNTQCIACPKQCGYAAYVVDGKIDKTIGAAGNAASNGTLCARGYGSAHSAYDEDRVQTPLKKVAEGTYSELGWDQALEEIAEAVQAVIDKDGPEGVALIQDGTPTAAWYGKRFMNALGSANCYLNATSANQSVASGLAAATGYTAYDVDYGRTRTVVILGASAMDATAPGISAALEQAKQDGANIYMVDARMPGSIGLATQWIPINPGTDLALVLSIANVLVSRGLFDKQQGDAIIGFDAWAQQLATYTPTWASAITGISADIIEMLAAQLGTAAPASCIDLTWMADFGGSYANSGELARAVALVNTMLGCWNQKGGAVINPVEADLSGTPFADIEVDAEDITAGKCPCAVAGSAAEAVNLAHNGTVGALFLVNADVVAEYPDTSYVAECLANCDLSVAITSKMNETAQVCDYVLPACTWSESDQLPTVADGALPAVVMSSQVIEPVVDEARPVADIVTDLACACGCQDDFGFAPEDVAIAQLAACGVTPTEAEQMGTVPLLDKAVIWGSAPVWLTESGQVEAAFPAAADAGYELYPAWTEPLVADEDLDEDVFRMITGNQAIFVTKATSDYAPLMDIAEKYHLDGLWINEETATDMGIAEGDEVVLAGNGNEVQVRAQLTKGIEPGTVYMASHYGSSAKDLKVANGVGANQASFATFELEPGYGAPLLQEVTVKVGKAGA